MTPYLFKSLIYEGPYDIEASPLICSENQRIGFYMSGNSAMEELIREI